MCAASQIDNFELDDLFDLVFPPEIEIRGYMCMVCTAYLDDSKDKCAKRVMVSAGFYGRRYDWLAFRVQWRRVLVKHGLDYYKSSECWSVDGQFRKFREGDCATAKAKQKAQDIRRELQEVVRSQPDIRAVGVAVQLEHYHRMVVLPGASDVLPADPYKAALCSVMFETTKAMRKHAKGHSKVAFVHDDSNPAYFDELRATYREFLRFNKTTAKYIGGFQPSDNKITPALQLADLIANHTTFLAGKHLDLQDAKVEMQENIGRLVVWDDSYIRAVLEHGLLKKGKPLPFELEE